MKNISKNFMTCIFLEIIFFIKILFIIFFMKNSNLESKKIHLPSEISFYYNFHLANKECVHPTLLNNYEEISKIIHKDLKSYKIHIGLTSLCKTKINNDIYYVATLYEVNFVRTHIYYFKYMKCKKYVEKTFIKEDENFYKIDCVSH